MQVSNNLPLFLFYNKVKLSNACTKTNIPNTLLANFLHVRKWLTLLSSSFRVWWEEYIVDVIDSRTICVHLQLEDLRRLSEMSGASANMAREELTESSLRIESLTAQLTGLQKEVGIFFYSLSFYFLTELELVS